MTRARRAIAPALGAAASAALFLATRAFDQGVPRDQLGPGFWPRLVLACLAGVCLIRLAHALRDGRTTPLRSDDTAPPPAPISRARLGAAVGSILLYVLAAPVIGFPLATLGFIAGFMWVCGARSAAGIIASASLGTVGLLYLFVKAVYLPLPKGDGPFEAVTLALYRLLRLF
jgi:putative tricarboxylic transport membrane protein